MELQIPALPEQDFFSMGEASRIAQVPAHTLRYWESQVGSLRPSRRSGGHRHYTRADMETVFFIKEMIQRRKMTVAGAKKALLSWRKGSAVMQQERAASGEPQSSATLKLLREVRKEIQQLVQELR